MLAGQLGAAAVLGEAEDAQPSSGAGVAAVRAADGVPDLLTGGRAGRQVDSGDREPGPERDQDDRLLGLEAEDMRDGGEQLVRL